MHTVRVMCRYVWVCSLMTKLIPNSDLRHGYSVDPFVSQTAQHLSALSVLISAANNVTSQRLPRPFDFRLWGKYLGQRQTILQAVACQDANYTSLVSLFLPEQAQSQGAAYSGQCGRASCLGIDSLVRGQIFQCRQHVYVSNCHGPSPRLLHCFIGMITADAMADRRCQIWLNAFQYRGDRLMGFPGCYQ